MRARPLALLLTLCLAPAARPQSPLVRVMAFGDVEYAASGREDEPDGFLLGQMVGHLSAVLTDRLAFFGEFTTTGRRASGFDFEAERLILRYDFSDRLKLSAGRYHVPVSYWYATYHHGVWLQTTAGPPAVAQPARALVPVHFVGVLAEGALPGPALGAGYAVGVGNGRGATLASPGNRGDATASRAALAALYVRPAALPGLQAGGGAYFDRVTSDSAARVDERIFTAHVAWLRESPELIAEYTRLLHRPSRGGEWAAGDAWYLQAAWRLPGGAQAFKPYARLERVRVSPADSLLAPLAPRYDAAIAGVRYDFAPYAALKAEYRRERPQGSDAAPSLWLQASFVVPSAGGAEAAPPRPAPAPHP